jgi:MerR family transcriptional regulator/heat shock protein HspR
MISVVARRFEVHPQTLRLYEREGLVKPSRTQGNTRLYSEEDLERLSFILNLTRDLGVNLAGVEIIVNLRGRIETMQQEMDRFVAQVRDELGKRVQEGAVESSRALVRVSDPGRSFKVEKR